MHRYMTAVNRQPEGTPSFRRRYRLEVQPKMLNICPIMRLC